MPLHTQPDQPDDAEEVDAVPVLASERAVAASPDAGAAVVRQAAAVAVGSFAAGVATVAAVRVGRSVASRRRRAKRLPIVASRSFLVDVHLLGERR
ncbi:MAG: hypothetical protein ACXVFN_06235 [Solirubrobacteraceae bacterium]